MSTALLDRHVAHPVNRAAVLWGVVVGSIQAATPLGFWWLPNQTVYAMGIAVIGAIYIGFRSLMAARRSSPWKPPSPSRLS